MGIESATDTAFIVADWVITICAVCIGHASTDADVLVDSAGSAGGSWLVTVHAVGVGLAAFAFVFVGGGECAEVTDSWGAAGAVIFMVAIAAFLAS